MAGFADESLIGDFVAESREHLDTIEPDLLAMERDGATVSQEIVNSVFRAIHSIKGGSGFFAFEALKRLSHTMENVLMQIRDGKMTVNPTIIDPLLRGVDKLRAMIDDIQGSDSVPCDEEIAQLNTVLESEGIEVNAQVTARTARPEDADNGGAAAQEFDLHAASVRSALDHGMLLYLARARIHRDIQDRNITPLDFLENIEALGSCLDVYVDMASLADLETCLEEDFAFSFLFATVLEEDLVAGALELPEDQIVPLDTAQLKKEMKAKAQAEEAAAAGKKEETPDAPGGQTPAQTQHVEHSEVAETLRVRVDLLTRLMNTAGELVLGRNQLMRAVEDYKDAVPGLGAILQNLDLVTTELQEGIMQTRMQPIGTVFGKFSRIVRDVSRDLGKEIELTIEGSEIELDKSIIEMLGDPLTHIIRNCCDHALETPEEREKAGKPRGGRILLRAYHEGGQVNISVADNGRGIDVKKVLAKAIEKGVVEPGEAERMSERDIVALIFAPGFSMAEKVTELSGRGVGMDVVRTNIEKLGGTIDVNTALGEGTTVLLHLPLTLAIIPSLIVGVGDQRFAVPQVNLVELVWVRASEVAQRIEKVQGAAVLRLRGRLLPLVRLSEALDMPRTVTHPETSEDLDDRRTRIEDRRTAAEPGEDGEVSEAVRAASNRRESWESDYNILVLQVGSNQFGIIVDRLFDSEEIVVKPLSSFINECKSFAGATILGDGRVIMILDAGGICEQTGLHFVDLQAEEERRLEEEARKEAATVAARRSIILFNGAPDEFFAVPQEKVLRLEQIDASNIEHVGGQEFIQYRGTGLPLIRLDQHLPVQPLASGLSKLFLIIPKHVVNGSVGEARAGILVSRIVDAMDIRVDLRESQANEHGLEGSAIVQDKLTVFLDPAELVASTGIGGEA